MASSSRGSSAQVRALPLEGDAAIVHALRLGSVEARAALWDRYHTHVRRVLSRVLGVDGELDDAVQDVFLQAMSSVDGLEDPSRLRGWLSQVAVFTARGIIRRRRRRRWLRFYAPEDVPEESATATQPVHDALRRARAILDRMDVDDRIAFALRFVDGMELTEVADACQVSLATIKRRLAAARVRFEDAARHDPVLGEMLRERAAGESP